MKNATQEPTETKTATAPTATAQTAQNAATVNAKAEASAYVGEINATLSRKLGNLAIDSLAVQLGESCSPVGRPSVVAYLALISALAAYGDEMTHERRQDVVRKAMAAHKAKNGSNLKFKPCAAQKASAGLGKGSSSYSLNVPVAIKIAAE